MRIAVCRPQVPFVYGGAELVADQLTAQLRTRGHTAEVVTVPFKWYPGTRVLDQAFVWRLLDLTEADGHRIDLVITTKFPSYAVRHPNKVIWLVHQLRQAYDYDHTELGQFSDSPEDRATRLAVERFDRVAFSEARKVFTISGNVANRLEHYLGVPAEVLFPPPQDLDFHTNGYEDFVLSVNRLDRAKRSDLLIEAAKSDPALQVVIVGDGPDRERLERLASEVNGRIEFTGRVDGERLADLYARCLALYYAPIDEDYGIAPYEAFLSEKPVVTTVDAGGPLEIVRDGRTGLVVKPDAAEIARACTQLLRNRDEAEALGRAGKLVAERVTWDHCIDRLLSHA